MHIPIPADMSGQQVFNTYRSYYPITQGPGRTYMTGDRITGMRMALYKLIL